MRDLPDKSFDQIADEGDFEFGGPEKLKNFDHLAIDWLLLLESIAFYVVYTLICCLILLLVFPHDEEGKNVFLAACSLVSSVPGALYLKKRVKNRRLAHGVYYSIVPMSVLAAQPYVIALGPVVATMLIAGSLFLTTTLATVNLLPLLIDPDPFDTPDNPQVSNNLYPDLQMPGDSAFSTDAAGLKPRTLANVNNPYLELDVSDDLTSNTRSFQIAWVSVLLAVVTHYLISFACSFVWAYSFRALFDATHRNMSVLFAISYSVRLIPWIVPAIFLAIKLRKKWLWNAMLFFLITQMISLGLMATNWNHILDLRIVLTWMLLDLVAVVLTCTVVRSIARIRRSIKKAV